MSHDVIAFDLNRCERCSRTIRAEAERLNTAAERFKRASDDSAAWWVGGSRTSYMRRANELETLMRKVADLTLEMSDNLTKSAEYKKASEENLKVELLKLA